MKVSCRHELPPFARAEKEPFNGETVSTLNPVPEVEVTPVEGSVSAPPFASKVLSLIRERVKLVTLVVVPPALVTLIGPVVTPAGATAVI